MKISTEILCDSQAVATKCESYARNIHRTCEYLFVRAFGVEGNILRVVYVEIGIDKDDPTARFEERLIGYRDGLQAQLEAACWGIWIGATQSWMYLDLNKIFWTTSRAVAEAQLKITHLRGRPDVEVRVFTPDGVSRP